MVFSHLICSRARACHQPPPPSQLILTVIFKNSNREAIVVLPWQMIVYAGKLHRHVTFPYKAFACLSAVKTYFSILTAAVALLITSIQTVIVSIALPQGAYAAVIMALELITFTSLWL